MNRYRIVPSALDDIQQIWRYLLGEAGLSVADQIQSELLNAFRGLTASPGIGHKRSDLTRHNVLFHVMHQYMIVYRRTTSVEIVAVLHGKRNIKRILNDRL